MQLVIMRHGQTDYNVDHRYAGVMDVPLNDVGREQAHAAGTDAGVSTVYVSHLSRSQETARICFPNAKQVVNAALSEMDFGDFQGRNPNEMAADEDYTAWVDGWCVAPCPNGESRDEYTARVVAGVIEAVSEQAKAGAERTVIVAHGGTCMASLYTLACANEAQDYYKWNPGNCCGYVADVAFNENSEADDDGSKPFELRNIVRFDRIDQIR